MDRKTLRESLDDPLSFNKDMACLMEIQRLEAQASNAAMTEEPNIRFACLRAWGSKILHKMTPEQQTNYRDLLLKSRMNEGRLGRSQGSQSSYNIERMNILEDFLNEMMIVQGLHLNKGAKGLGATKV